MWDSKSIHDLIVPLTQCATVTAEATLFDALVALEKAQSLLPPGRPRHRAVLVLDLSGRILGKIGELSFVTALGASFTVLKKSDFKDQVGLTPDYLNSIFEHYRFLKESHPFAQNPAMAIKAGDIMHPVTESIDGSASVQQAVDAFSRWKTLSLLVTEGSSVLGLLRLSDLFREITREILAASGASEKRDA
jgi:CBS domain-containing protein